MSNSFSKNVTLYSITDEGKMTWNLKIQDSGLSGSANYAPVDGEAVEFPEIGGVVQYQGGIYNGPFTIDVTSGMAVNGDAVSAALTVNDDWASGEGGFLIEVRNGNPISAPYDTPISN